MESIIIFLSIILVASVLQTSTGFGFSIMATPFLLMIFVPQEAIQINIVLSLVISAALIVKIKDDIDMELLKRISLGSLASVPAGILIFMLVNVNAFKLGVSIVLLLVTILLLLSVKVRATPNRDYWVGGISGLLTTSIGMPGPPLLIYFTGTNTGKEKLRATTLAFYLIIYSISLITQMIFAGTSKTVWLYSVYAIPVVFIGLFAGQILFKRLSQRMFRILTYILLSFTGVYLFLQSI